MGVSDSATALLSAKAALDQPADHFRAGDTFLGCAVGERRDVGRCR
jgi:hypothetical protein